MYISCINASTFLLSLFLFYDQPSLFSQAASTISQGESISDGQTLISANGVAELGFFSPGNSTNRYVGIWYHKIPMQTVVWVANRESPLTDSSGVLTIESDGNLKILDGTHKIIWSSNVSMTSNNSIAMIMDNANLILQKRDSNDNLHSILWQSFDHPTDTFLPGMKVGLDLRTGVNQLTRSWMTPNDPSPGKFSFGMDPQGQGQNVLWKGINRRWRTGRWDGQKFQGVPHMRQQYLYGFRLSNENEEGKIYFTYNMMNASDLMRFVTTWDGREEELQWDEYKMAWNVIWREPVSDCEMYGKCGNFGWCTEADTPICSCLKGFEPRSLEEWSNGNWTRGCVRRRKLECEKDGFFKVRGVKLPDLADWVVLENKKACEERCLRNCSCTGYAHVSGIGCMMWWTDLLDIQRFNNGGNVLYVRLSRSELGEKSGIFKIVVVTVSGAIFLIICAYILWRCIAKIKDWLKKGREVERFLFSLATSGEISTDEIASHHVKVSELPLINFSCVAAATSNFSDANKLGQGGFGPVYKGILRGGQEVAVKRLSKGSFQGLEEFENEVILIAKLQHRNLVRLLGCCIQGEEKILLYEYMPNKSLDTFLFDPKKKVLLDWEKRFNIIEGIARGLLYLHRDSRLRIIHRDLKASNILLDGEMNPKISDFGMAKIFGGNQNQANTNRVVGTYGYMSPEYAMEGLFSVKSDVYSFGVLLLEILSGKKNTSFHQSGQFLSLLGYAWNLWKEDKATELIDPSLSDSYSSSEVLRCINIGLLCVQDSSADRPTMSSVVLMLGSEIVTHPTPKQPTFSIARSNREAESMHDPQNFSTNDVTITVIIGR
ncbi:G-type lectin S-receptor-like serine/threonine-protein kinase B120 [Magnolia sinica]|uniref:G-type lectin S-receptor-like serine/threonine-protein kinase B120 n=1 Tax=Magnolia sinica TaxID=86752 RepID=UPI002658DCEF|nr:G-type lectin S-receptor-like serine/threonine-protein kinase B120 [Magnolia sinica]